MVFIVQLNGCVCVCVHLCASARIITIDALKRTNVRIRMRKMRKYEKRANWIINFHWNVNFILARKSALRFDELICILSENVLFKYLYNSLLFVISFKCYMPKQSLKVWKKWYIIVYKLYACVCIHFSPVLILWLCSVSHKPNQYPVQSCSKCVCCASNL